MQMPSAATGAGGSRQNRRIVVGVDGSDGARAGLAWALAEAARRGAEVDVLSAVPVDFYWDDPYLRVDGGVDRVRADTETRAQALIEEVRRDPAVASVTGSAGVPVGVVVVAGPPAQFLVDRADGADLLVVGSRGRGAARSTVLGSVALHCVTHAPCPVVVVHPPRTAVVGAGTVVVGLDDSVMSRSALRAAVAEATGMGAEVEAVLVYRRPDLWSELYTLSAPPPGETHEHALRGGERIVAEVLGDTAGRSGLRVRVVAVEGPAGPVLARRAEEAALLVVGSRSRSTLRGLVLGSVALHCVIHATVPVMVVHPEGALQDPAVASAAAGG